MFCLSDITVFPDELDWSDIPDTNVFSLSASEACFRLAIWGVGGLDTEYMKSSLSSPLMEQESPLLIEKAAESGVPASKCSGLEGESIIKLINTINFDLKLFGNSSAQWNSTFWLHRANPSYYPFGHCSCKQDTREWQWGHYNFVKCKGWVISVRLT